jgi:hypothetical protein
MKRLLRGFWKTIITALPGDLLWRRFSPLRSVVMPMRVLENVRFREAKQRKRVLETGGLNHGAFLTIWGIALSAVLLCGEMLFSVVMIELIQENYISSVKDFLLEHEIFFYAAWCINFMLVESMYVCMGFGQYINSRIEVEGWDLEIIFRNISKAGKKSVLTVLLFITMFGIFLPASASASETAQGAVSQAAVPLETLEEIFASGELGGEKDGWGIRLKNPIEPKELPDFNFDSAPWIEKIMQFFAVSLRFLLFLIIAAVVILIFLYFFKNHRGKKSVGADLKSSSLVIKKKENPELLLEKAQLYYTQGEIRTAWAYCFAAALGFWEQARGIVFPDTATEYECIRLVRSSNDQKESSGSIEPDRSIESEFADLVMQWAGLAYGGRTPGEGAFEKALLHCKNPELHRA